MPTVLHMREWGLQAVIAHSPDSRVVGRIVAGLVLAVAAIPAAAHAAANGLPDLPHGLWEARGVAEGRAVQGRKCTNPTRDIMEENAVLARAGCRISPIEHSGNRYTFESDCEMKTRSGRHLTSYRTSILTVDGDSLYRLTVRGTTNGKPIAETVTWTRVGDCDK